MSCPNSTAPIDISISKIVGKCELKCSYVFNYSASSCVATNRGDYVSISYDKSSTAPVLYNATSYDVQEIRLYTPSLHSYNDIKADAEFIIVHNSNTGSNPLLVCIPIRSNNSLNLSSRFFETLVDTMSSSAPVDGDATTVIVPKFNLEYFIPKKPFFSYSATEPYQPCNENVEYIVFNPLNSELDISPNSLELLQTIITTNPYDVKSGVSLFYNEKGPTMNNNLDDNIYIDCQPVGSSDETVDTYNSTTGSSTSSTNDILNNPFVKILLSSLLFIFILYGIKTLLTFLKPNNSITMSGGKIMNIISEPRPT